MDYVARTPEQLGQILKSCRIERKLTQQAAGTKVGLKQSTVSVVESDAARTSVETLYKLLSALQLELVLRDRNGDTASVPKKNQREW
ncbi:MAG: helix-turn-helix protein [Hydrocarboniphaga sp.]|uniref:helix-turn-helix domain-containing protein n=1 Tax=Hydrocarboniphaga sp. TaxID=2033016 RepID=UPI00262BE0B6|nr:helix-turn-helix domain-containing protein [Hydrocarboniphaga sp.]MDB5971707.1 helix-turn-helix protein [Hydrocarboniphaga sp.]